MEKSPGPGQPRKTTRAYAVRIFQESSVGVVSSIAHTSSKRRRIYKAIAFLLCLTGFLYQGGTFLAAVFQYPTTVAIDIKRPEMLTVPAFTFCDNNNINRRMFCEKFPDRCEEPTEAFCEKYTLYCDENNPLVPKKQYYKHASEKTLQEMMELNVQLKEFAEVQSSIFDNITEWASISDNLTGPYLRVNDDTDSASLCYSLFERINNSLLPLQAKQKKLSKESYFEFTFKVKEEDIFLPGNEPGVLFSIHSPFQAVNPFDFGIFMKPGRKYLIFVQTEAEVLLPYPYATNCVNYTEIWEKNGRTGPRMQEMCREECWAELSMRCYNCVESSLIYGSRERYCTPSEKENDNCPADIEKLVDQCAANCRDDCKQTKFTYTVQERFNPHFNRTGDEIEDLGTTIRAEIFLEGDEIVVLKHSPKYMFVEVFSNIGGFIGCWLGINLLDITDILDGVFRITRYSMKRR